MANFEEGLDKANFVDQIDSFDCIICFKVARNPLECLKCGQTYCSTCQNEWRKGSGQYCCLKCEGTQMQVLNQHLMEGYNNLKYRCTCKQIVLLKDLKQHEILCKQPNCKYSQFCGKKVSKKYESQSLCSTTCLIFEWSQQQPIDQKGLYNRLMATLKNKPLTNSIPSFAVGISKQNLSLIKPSIPQLKNNSNYSGPLRFKWDTRDNFKGEKIQINNDGTVVALKENFYIFKSVVADTPFESGKHYFEIEVHAMTENELKIGVVTNNTFNKSTAFCDLDHGFGFYSLGKLRNGSNANGSDYGIKFKNSGTCGVYLDMTKGILAFSYDGKSLGKAFETPKLQQAPIYASVSLLHCAGFTLKSGLPIPNWTLTLA